MPENERKPAEPAGEPAKQLSQDIGALSAFAERLRTREYVELLQKPWRLVAIYFVTGIARGAGVTIGTIIVLALLTYVLSTMVTVPVVGKYLAGIVEEVQRHLPAR